MIKKHIFEIDGTEIELTPEQCQQLRDELLRLYPGDYLLTQLPVSSPIQPLMPPPIHLIPRIGDKWPPDITCGQTACNFRDVSVWQ